MVIHSITMSPPTVKITRSRTASARLKSLSNGQHKESTGVLYKILVVLPVHAVVVRAGVVKGMVPISAATNGAADHAHLCLAAAMFC